MQIRRWISPDRYVTYDIVIPIFADDTVGKFITKISVNIDNSDQDGIPKPDLSMVPYLWSDKRPVAFTVTPAPDNVNPFLSEQPWHNEKYSLVRHWEDLIGDRSTLNIAFLNDVPSTAKHRGYFPEKWKCNDTYAGLLQESMKLQELWDAGRPISDSKTPSAYIFSKVAFTGDIGKTVNMEEAISILKSRQTIPFHQFIFDNTKIMYKIAKKHNLSAELLNNAVAFDRLPKIHGIVVILPMRQNEANASDVYARVVLDVSGKVSVYYRITNNVVVPWEDIMEFNKISVGEWLMRACGRKCKLTVTSIAARTSMITKRIGISDLRKDASRYGAIFHLDAKRKEIVYKRSVNYKAKLDIIADISSQINAGVTEREVLENLVSHTGMSSEEASNWMKQYHSSVTNEDMGTATHKRRQFLSTGCMVRIKPAHSGFAVLFDNMGSLHELHSATRWIRGLINIVKSKDKDNHNDNDNGKGKAHVELPKTSSTTSSEAAEAQPQRPMVLDEQEELVFDDSDSSSGGAADTDGYFVDMLTLKDRDVFTVTSKDKRGKRQSYSRLCGANNFRQPVVRDTEQMKKLDEQGFGASIDDRLEYRNNTYFCPRIWCPKAEIPIKEEQLLSGPVGKDGKPTKICPGPYGEEPMYQYTDDYWDKDPKAPHYIGFLDKKRSDKGLCMPCCMRKPLIGNKAPKAVERLEKCLNPANNVQSRHSASAKATTPNGSAKLLPKETLSTPAAPIAPAAAAAAPVKDDTNFILSAPPPIPEGRYGTISEDLHTAVFPSLPYTSCSMNLSSTPCLVRFGIPYNPSSLEHDPLIDALCVCLDIRNKTSFVEHVRTHIDPIKFLCLDDGNVLKAFLPETSVRQSLIRKDFRDMMVWIHNSPKYYKVTSLKTSRQQLRQLMIYNAYKDFLQHLASRAPKNQGYVVDLMNRLGYTLIIVDSKQNDILCPRTVHDKIIVLSYVDDGKAIYYEPIVSKTRSGPPTLIFNKDDKQIVGLLALIIGKNSCDVAAEDEFCMKFHGLQNWVDMLMISKSYLTIKHIILSPDLKIYGFLTGGNVIVEAPGGIPLGVLGNLMNILNVDSVIYLEDLVGEPLVVKSIPQLEFGLFCDKMQKHYGLNVNLSFSSQPLSGVTTSGEYNITTSFTFDLAYPAIRLQEKNISPFTSQDEKWHSAKQGVLKILIDHYDTLVRPLIIDQAPRHKILHTLLKTFRGMTGSDKQRKSMIYHILEQMPLFEGKEMLQRWKRMDFIDRKWIISTIQETNNEWIFTQLAANHGLPDYILYPQNGPLPNKKYMAQNAIVREIESVANLKSKPTDGEDVMIPPTAKGTHELLPSKWRVKSFAEMKVVIGDELTLLVILQWLSKNTRIPLSERELRIAREYTIVSYAQQKERFAMLMMDPSICNFLKRHLVKNKVLKSADEVVAEMFKNSSETFTHRKNKLAEVFKTHGSNIDLSDADWEVMSKFYGITIFMIRNRAIYTKRTEEKASKPRGDDNDRIVSAQVFFARDWKIRPMILIYKDSNLTSAKSSYRHIIYKGSPFIQTCANLPDDIINVLKKIKGLQK